jgi:hypothetical protein
MQDSVYFFYYFSIYFLLLYSFIMLDTPVCCLQAFLLFSFGIYKYFSSCLQLQFLLV